MKFRFGTKEEQSMKIVADPEADEKTWLAACEVLGDRELVKQVDDGEEKSSGTGKSPFQTLASFTGTSLGFIILVFAQIFMVAGAAVSSGTLASSAFGLSFDRVMYHCGPQDTYTGIFVLAAIPIFWCAWYLRKRKYARFLCLCSLGLLFAFLLGPVLTLKGAWTILASTVTFALFGLFQLGGTYFSSLKKNWPRSFSVTRLLLICYVPALAALAYEFSVLDLNSSIDKVSSENMLTCVGIIAAFAFLPAILTAIFSGARRFPSALGLSAIGQLPVLACTLLYLVGNGIMLACISVFGATALSDYFAANAGNLPTPDFDLSPNNYAEILAKFVSSLIVFAWLSGSIWIGSAVGVFFNRWRNKGKDDNSIALE